MAEVIPFPLARRRKFIARQAEHAAEMTPDAAIRYLQYQLKVQRDAMQRKGIAAALIHRELQSMDQAIRAAFICQRAQPGGAHDR